MQDLGAGRTLRPMNAVWIVLLVLAVFPLFWSGVCIVIGMMGWSRLAAAYRTEAEATGETFRLVTGMVGLSSYRSVLTVSLEPEGLRLAVMPLFRPGHPPLLLPWGDLLNVRKSTVLFSTAYAFETEQGGHVTIRLPERVAEAIADAAA
ncbi:MAG: hypothetical protein AAF170_09950 [Bacteroidota bacterium]